MFYYYYYGAIFHQVSETHLIQVFVFSKKVTFLDFTQITIFVIFFLLNKIKKGNFVIFVNIVFFSSISLL